jgi:thiol-disulfide isomerase/thioredoxin
VLQLKKPAIIAAMLVVLIIMPHLHADAATYKEAIQKKLDKKSTKTDKIKETKKITPTIDKTRFKKAPELRGITGYINTGPDELKAAMKNKVVLYDFWTYSCYNCQNTFPYVKAWHQKYSDKGLIIVGIHYPEFSFERDINNVKQAVANNNIKFPVILDNDGRNWKAFGNHYWPRFYLADHEGYIRYDHIGEGAYEETEKMIQKLLKERA